ncbi:hypothetical protein [Mycobacterium lehmannii]|nr:hypothetical protein [Mycobacterium lehmannii]
MPSKKPVSRVGFMPLPPAYVTELRDNPDGADKPPIEVGRFLPGERGILTIPGGKFRFTVRVIRDEDGNPQIVDFHMRSRKREVDVPITNMDLKSVPIAQFAERVASPTVDEGIEIQPAIQPKQVRRPGRPTLITDDFLREVTRSARQGKQSAPPSVDNYEAPLNGYIATWMRDAGLVSHLAPEKTVLRWRRLACERRRKSPEDNSFLRSGELRGKPGKGAGR